MKKFKINLQFFEELKEKNRNEAQFVIKKAWKFYERRLVSNFDVVKQEKLRKARKKKSERSLVKRKPSAKKLKTAQAPKAHLTIPSHGKNSNNSSAQKSKESASPPNSRSVTQVFSPKIK